MALDPAIEILVFYFNGFRCVIDIFSLRWHYISGEHWHYTGTRHNWNWGIAIKGISKAMCHWQTSLVYTGELFHCQILANINGFTLANSGSGYIISYHGIRQDQSIGEQLQTLASIGENWGASIL